LIPSLFNNGDFQKRFEDQLANLDLNNPTAVKALTNELSEAIMALGDPEVTQEMAVQMAENMIEQQSQSVESFLKVAQETYATMSEITSLQEKALKDGLDLADALKAAEKFGSESLSFVGEGTYTLNYGELETKRRNEELALTWICKMILSL
jgi:tRNA(Ile2) C34 agmatinyltransferase TiaS